MWGAKTWVGATTQDRQGAAPPESMSHSRIRGVCVHRDTCMHGGERQQ